MSRRQIGGLGTWLVALVLVTASASAQKSEKVSTLPVPVVEKQKSGLVEEIDPQAEREVIGEEETGTGDTALIYAEDDFDISEGPRLPVAYDSAAVAPRTVPVDRLDRFLNDPAYHYDRVETRGPSLWEAFLRWLDRVLFQPIGENTTPLFWRILWSSLAVLLLAWLVTRLLRADGSGLFRRRDADLDAPEGAILLDTEDIEAVDLDALLERALAAQRYRDAARFLYLRALQALTARGLIDWQKNKTNREYLRELRRTSRADLGRPFADVTRLFEWIWYGEATVDAARFAAVQVRFDRLTAALDTIGEAARP
ncbi:MAG: DUF4129 domain-containing protein [Rhodothermaceae bacterium]|nr:DUF4129 domain-containing protein [Rhodothermaceae bacterium]